MKLHQLALAVAALAAGSASAAIYPTFTINLDGSSSLGNSVTEASKSMCAGGAGIQLYQGGPGNKIKGVYCSDGGTRNSGLPAGTRLFIVKNNADGSLAAFNRAIKRNAQTTVLDPATCAAPTFNGNPLTCGTKLVNAHGGFSDVEAKIWQARGQFDPAGVAFTTKSGFAGQGFGVAVTNKLYAALQMAQGLVPGVYDVANQPNITKQQFTSILSSSGAYHTDWTPILGAAGVGATNNMNLCRRTNASGTQAGMDVYFLDNPCAGANPTFGKLDPAVDASSSGSFKVIENAGTSDVKTCLNAHNQNQVNAAVKADGTAADEYAIGIISLENTPMGNYTPPGNYPGPPDNWHFVKLDGITPTPDANHRQTVIDGQYNYAFESVFVYRNDNTLADKNFMNRFVALMSNPTPQQYAPVGLFNVPGAFSYSAFPTRVHRGSSSGQSCSPFSLSE